MYMYILSSYPQTDSFKPLCYLIIALLYITKLEIGKIKL